MLVDPHVAYAEKIGIDKETIGHALILQLQISNSKFTNRQNLPNAILEPPKHRTEENNKCIKCKREQRNPLCMPCGSLVVFSHVYVTHFSLFCEYINRKS